MTARRPLTPRATGDPATRRRLRTHALLLGPQFLHVVEVYDAGGNREQLLAAMIDVWDPYGEDRFCRLKEVLYLTGLPRATLYRKMKDGSFPKNVTLDESGKVVGWPLADVRSWMRECIRNP